MPAYISGLGICLPNEPVGNDRIENVLGMIGGRPSRLKEVILARNGIQSRYYAVDPGSGQATHSNAQLTAAAIRHACEQSGCSLDELQLLACGTSSPDQFLPGHASMVHGLLGIAPCEVVTTAGVCCSGMTALRYASLVVESGQAARAAVTGSELASSFLHARHFDRQRSLAVGQPLSFDEEFLRWMLSDGAGTMLLAPQPRAHGPSLRIDWLDILSCAGELETCMYAGAVKQANGALHFWREAADAEQLLRGGYLNLAQDVALLEKTMLPIAFRKCFDIVRRKRELRPENIEWLLPHLSSFHFRQPVYDCLRDAQCEMPLARWFTNLPYKGNTGSASIFIMLEELLYSGRLRPGDRLLCVVPESARFMFAFLHVTVV